jgi:glycosyltransferase involved in cell wall biosynthesis/peptidoglycan/xylan/chitin deacetylase (PgdA/CDA1 family)
MAELESSVQRDAAGPGRRRWDAIDWRRFEPLAARLFFAAQLLRLRAERILSDLAVFGRQRRVLATACWSFPIYSQTFVYQELTQLIRGGFHVRFLYSHLDREQRLSSQFRPLWRARRRLTLDPGVCERAQEYFECRMPERVNRLVMTLSRASGLTPEAVRGHRHFRQAFAFARMVEAYRPAYIHSYFFYEGSLFALVASQLLGVPRGVSCYADHMLDDYDLKVVALQLRLCPLVIATSERIKQELLAIAPAMSASQILVKPNGINVDRFPAVDRAAVPRAAPFRIVTVCRIEPKKGLVYLIRAVRQLRDGGLPVECHVIGGVDNSDASHAYHQEVNQLIDQLDLRGAVHLEGVRSEEEINRFFRDAHVFAAPFIETDGGDKDGIPTAVLEAMAAGLPIVATNAGSIPEIIEHSVSGLVVTQRDPGALAAAIASLAGDAKRRASLGRQAAASVRSRFDAATLEKAFHEFLSGLLSRQPPHEHAPADPAPLVSVIIIFLNAERFIEEAIESVRLQTFEHWELLLVDDGSTDGSTRIAQRLASEQPDRVRYLEHPGHANLGMSASRNAGIAQAKGKYVAFLDADDVWLPWKLQQQIAILESHSDVAMVVGAAEYWQGWTGRAEDRLKDRTPNLGIEADCVHRPPDLSIRLYPLGLGTAPCPSDFLVRRTALEDVGGFEESFRGAYEDQAFLSKLYLRHGVFLSRQSWIRYRVHGDSCMANVVKAGQYQTIRQNFLDWLDNYVQARGLANPALRQAIDEANERNRCEAASVDGDDAEPRVGHLEFGSFRRLAPISTNWGFERGQPVDRYYIERFLERSAADVRGHVLEIEDRAYTIRYGADRVTESAVLHVTEGNPRATVVGDLVSADHIPSDNFDCVILTQVLQLIYDTRAALRTLHRILKPGGVLLATFPGITRISHVEWEGSWYWSFTTASARRLFEETFPGADTRITAHGNVLVATAFLQGLAAGELTPAELAHHDPDYELLIAVRAVKLPTHAGADQGSEEARTEPRRRARTASPNATPIANCKALILMYHRVADEHLDPWSLCVTPERFAGHLAVISEIAPSMRLADWLEASPTTRPERTVIVTFDDGYADNFHVAKPLLERFGVPTTLFVTTGAIGFEGEFWWDELESLFLLPGDLPASLRLDIDGSSYAWQLAEHARYDADEQRRHRAWTTGEPPPTRRHAMYLEVYRLLRPLTAQSRQPLLAALRSWASAPTAPRARRALSRTELLAMGDLVDIGAHTVTHPQLSALSLDAQRVELTQSRIDLETLLGRSITSFAYPFGDYDDRTLGLVAEAGFTSACTTRAGRADQFSALLSLPRVGARNWTADEFRLTLREWLA